MPCYGPYSRMFPLGLRLTIDERVDAGRILVKRPIEVYPDDTILDVTERLHEVGLEVLPEALELARQGVWVYVEDRSPPNRKMRPEEEREALERFSGYVAKYSRKER